LQPRGRYHLPRPGHHAEPHRPPLGSRTAGQDRLHVGARLDRGTVGQALTGDRSATAIAVNDARARRSGEARRHPDMSDRTLYLVACGAPWAARVVDGAREARERQPDEAKRPPPADAIAVVPTTFDTLNAWATGVANTYPLATLCAALGARHPIVAVPFAKHDLAGHPAWAASLAVLRYAGYGSSILRPVRSGPPSRSHPGRGDRVTEDFRWSWVRDQLGHDDLLLRGRTLMTLMTGRRGMARLDAGGGCGSRQGDEPGLGSAPTNPPRPGPNSTPSKTAAQNTITAVERLLGRARQVAAP
jgi:Flavoprotein